MNAVISSTLTPQSLSSAPAANQTESEPVKSVENETGMQNATSDEVLSSKYDTLELSQDYRNYRTHNESSTLEGDTSQLISMASKQPPAGSPPPKEPNDSENSNENDSLVTQSTISDSTATSSAGESEEETVYT